jgi:lipopolysaccharide export system protein LptA
LARGHITFKAQDCYGLSDTVTYHEGKDQVILEGNPARLYRMKLHGGNQEELRAKKIIYLRKTGEFHIIQGEGVQGQTQ